MHKEYKNYTRYYKMAKLFQTEIGKNISNKVHPSVFTQKNINNTKIIHNSHKKNILVLIFT